MIGSTRWARGLLARAAVLVALIAASFPTGTAAQDERGPGGPLNLVVLTSYNEDIPWQRLYLKGLRDAAEASTTKFNLYFENLDRKRAGANVRDQTFVDYLGEKFGSLHVDAVITHGVDASKLMNAHGRTLFPAARFVMEEVEEYPLGTGIADVVVVQDENMRKSLDVALTLHPGTRRVMVVADTTADGADRIAKAKQAFSALGGRIAFDYVTDFSVEGLYARAAALPEDSLIFYLLVFKDNTGRLFVPRAVATQLAATAAAPVYSLWDSLLGSGIAGGYLVSGEVMGRRSFETALQLIAGADGKTIDSPETNAFMFDWRALTRWNANFGALPADAVIRYHEPTFLERYLWETVAGLAFLIVEAILIVALVILYRQRSQAFAELAKSEVLLQRRFDDQTAELQRSNADLQQFAYSVSHDLRAPLRTVSGFVSLIRRRLADRLDDETRELIDFAIDGAGRMDRMIVDLLSYSRLQREKVEMEAVLVAEVVDAAVANLGAAVKDESATIEQSDLPVLFGDRAQLTRLFQNLIGNAIAYRKPDVPPIVTIRSARDGAAWHFTIADNGIGIPKDSEADVFTLFRRLHPEGPQKGSGIGLTVCRRVIENHGGRIWLESEEGVGTTVHFVLPDPLGDRNDAKGEAMPKDARRAAE